MEIHSSDPEDEDEEIEARPVVLEVAPKPEKPEPGPVVTEKRRRAPLVTSDPGLKKRTKSKLAAVSNAMVLTEASDLTRNRGKARVHSRNGLILGSTVPPPRGWNAKLSNEWGISFTRIRVESEGRELAKRTKSLGVRGSTDGSVTGSQSQKHRAWAMMARQGRARTAAAAHQRFSFDPNGSTASAIGLLPYQGGSDEGNAPFDAQFWEQQQQFFQQPFPRGDSSMSTASGGDVSSLLHMQHSIQHQADLSDLGSRGGAGRGGPRPRERPQPKPPAASPLQVVWEWSDAKAVV